MTPHADPEIGQRRHDVARARVNVHDHKRRQCAAVELLGLAVDRASPRDPRRRVRTAPAAQKNSVRAGGMVSTDGVRATPRFAEPRAKATGIPGAFGVEPGRASPTTGLDLMHCWGRIIDEMITAGFHIDDFDAITVIQRL